jgi:hypothetical protein
MEHLPEIKDPAYPLPNIHYLGHIIEYDENGFFDFPQRHGWSLYHPMTYGFHAIRRHNEGPRHVNPEFQTPENIAALVQAWLFFGVLHEIFNTILGLDLPLQEFIEIRDGGKFISTRELRRYLKYWEELQSRTIGDHYFGRKRWTSSENIELQSRVKNVLSEVNWFFHQYLDRGSGRPWARCLTLDLQLAILILAETVTATGLYMWGQLITRQVGPRSMRILVDEDDGSLSPENRYLMQGSWQNHPLHQINFMRPVELLQERFLQLGWCPHEHKMLCGLSMHETQALFVASRLKRTFSSRELSHVACSSDRCSASFINPETYITRHTSRCRDNSKCRFLGFDSGYLAQQIEEGRVPLVRLDSIIHEGREHMHPEPGHEESEPIPPVQERLEMQHAGSGDYIALSHVWSHGLGNPVSNTLPTCQLRHLKAVATQMLRGRALATEPAIWIDTLCVPVDPRHQSSRRKAISGIVDVFRKARRVVVLDADLQEASIKAGDHLELCIRILCSHWMRRLWTLAEAVISNETPNCQRLYVMFADGPFEYNTIMRKAFFGNYSLDGPLQSLTTRLPQERNGMDRFLTLIKALEYRSTSWLEDEAICLAGISGVDIRQIVQQTTADKRMKKWYSLLREIPLAFVFHNAARLEIEGYRWAPRSLLTTISSRDRRIHGLNGLTEDDGSASKRLATITEQGVLLDSVSALLIQDMKPSSTICWSGVGFWAASNISEHHIWLLTAHLDDPDTEHNEIDIQIPDGKPLVVIRNPFDEMDAILASVAREEDGITYCEYLRKAHLKLRHEKNQNVLFYEQWDRESGSGSSTRITLHHMPDDTKWCIG